MSTTEALLLVVFVVSWLGWMYVCWLVNDRAWWRGYKQGKEDALHLKGHY